ncbi:MAG: hypothetical protein FWC00_00290 [Firmicutes bacterium]|nr:hypothetical protein [Bacillota bacterium]
MNIGVDVDGVLTRLVEFVRARTGLEKFEDYYGFVQSFVGNGSNKDFWAGSIWDYTKLPPIDGAVKNLKKLRQDGHKIIINTNRWFYEREDELGNKMREAVHKWFDKYEVPYDEFVFAKGDKAKVVKEYKLDIHIDDAPHEIQVVRPHIPVIVFDADYNKEFAGENIIRVKNWDEIYRVISSWG